MINASFDGLLLRLQRQIKQKIDSGEYSERSLARVLEVSQPHLHNMLKGVRRMNPRFADRVLRKFKIDVFDLFNNDEIIELLDLKDPHWSAKLSPRRPAVQATERESDPRAPWRTGS